MDPDNLPPKKILAATNLVSGKSGVETAELVGVKPETISRWKQEPKFAAYLNGLKLEAVADARDHLRALNAKAVGTIKTLLDSTSDAIKLRAAQFVVHAMILEPETAEKGIDVADEKTDEHTVRLRWTPEMDKDWEELLAHETKHHSIYGGPLDDDEPESNEEPTQIDPLPGPVKTSQ